MLAHRLALGTVVATAVLIVFGGLVTNTGAALAVPDWPNTFGHNLFLYPWSGMVGGIFYELSHRLLGATVGLLTLALAAALWRRGGTLRVLGLAARAGDGADRPRPAPPRRGGGGGDVRADRARRAAHARGLALAARRGGGGRLRDRPDRHGAGAPDG